MRARLPGDGDLLRGRRAWEWKQFTPVNAEWFADNVSGLGSPGGAAQVGPAAVDHPVVAGWEAV